MKQDGPVTTKVSDTLCTAAPLDMCSCKCFHDAQWTCEGDAVVCKAKYGEGELETVGDLVCETRAGYGVQKPTSVAELKMASECTPVTDFRGSSPTAECLEQWSATTAAPTTKKPETTVAATTAKPSTTEKPPVAPLITSFAVPVAFAALALYA